MTKRTPIRGTLYQTHALHISLFSLYVYCHSWWRDAKELGDDLIIWSVGEWNGKGILNKSGKPGKIERNHLKRTSITWCSLLSECISPIPKFNKKKIVSPCCKNILSSSGKGWGDQRLDIHHIHDIWDHISWYLHVYFLRTIPSTNKNLVPWQDLRVAVEGHPRRIAEPLGVIC